MFTSLCSFLVAQAPASQPSTDPSVMFPELVEAAKSRNWAAVAGLVLGFLVYALTKLPAIDSKMPPTMQKWIPGITAVMSAASGILVAGGKWYEAIAVGVITGIGVFVPSPKQVAQQQ